MKDHAVDALIPPPADGLTPYRRPSRSRSDACETDAVETSWLDAEVLGVPSDPLPSDPDWAGKSVFVDARTASTPASPDRLWRVIEGIGGENGWYSSPLLWAIRGWMDRLVGGIGLARGRRSRDRLEVGDALDFWRVEAIEPGSFLRLRAEMKVPGLAWLELRASADGRAAHATTSARCSSRRVSPGGCTGSRSCRSTGSSSAAWRTASPPPRTPRSTEPCTPALHG